MPIATWWRRERLHTTGAEPDYRFTLANERTLLAHLCTALALMAAGGAVVELTTLPGRTGLGVLLIAAGGLHSALSHRRWRGAEHAIRTNAPLPGTRLPWTAACVLAAAALALTTALVSG
ncbi:YidH family protein [Streptomyces sp. JJ38]|uniref:YidH family protein n=1 Tax=Streptomyces sp. JJ38 TaxID=2738128 RepID=UPI001C565593|nr:DUF202 domain-containing protein [Streptomyces sp. JJ38]MBW1599487.1 DUF202 domain-containing protein [Streptomyces sp. JJ38]